MKSTLAVAASDPMVREACEPLNLSRGSALAVALAAYLLACALHAGVLLSPVSVLFCGFGSKRAFDGRVRQPGLGLPRPRGYKPEQAVPAAAQVGVPRSLPLLFVGWGYDHKRGHAAEFAAAVTAARRAGAPRRAELLRRAGEIGAPAFRGSDFEREMLRAFGPAQGGLLSRDDLVAPVDVDQAASGDDVLALPWSGELDEACGLESQQIVAIDRSGNAAAVCYAVAKEGVVLFDGQLICPLLARPVLRGVPRTRPGTALPLACRPRIELDSVGRAAVVESGPLRLSRPE